MRFQTRRRSDAAEVYRRWYKTARWQALRLDVLRRDPLCVMCAVEGKTAPATVCDHVIPHRGDEALFWGGPFQALCAPCHDSRKRAIELRGFDGLVGDDGWPLDAAHPANRGC